MMSDQQIRIFPLGDSALTVEFGQTIATELNISAIALSSHFEQHPFPGFIESVPAYASTTLFYDLPAVRREFPDFPSVFDAVKNLASAALGKLDNSTEESSRTIEVPVYFDDGSALDIDHIVQRTGLDRSKIIDIFTERTYRVFMLGFLPGFTYMGEVDDRIATPRKQSPRIQIPKGSVGIAGTQTGIYSLESPGGWQIIGRTDVEMFTPEAENPCYLRPGDHVRFFWKK